MQLPWKFATSFDQEFQSDLNEVRNCRSNVMEEVSLAKAQVDLRYQQLQAAEREKAEHSRASITRLFSYTKQKFHKTEDWQVRSSDQESGKHNLNLLKYLYLCATSEEDATAFELPLHTRFHEAVQAEQ